MDRLACVSLRALPLQLLLRRHPEWVHEPVAVVADERPQSAVLWTNGHARAHGVVPGMRYGGALSLTPGLRAAPLLSDELATELERIAALLRRLSPGVEKSEQEPGIFWLDASGLQGLYPSLQRWARLIVSELRAVGLEASVVVGCTRFGTYAIARSATSPTVICANAADEQRLAAEVELAALDVEPTLTDVLFRLGVTTLAGLKRLPEAELAHRFGSQAHRLHRLVTGKGWEPLQPTTVIEPVRRQLSLDEPELDSTRLLFLIKGLLHPLLGLLQRRSQRLAGATVRLRLDTLTSRAEDKARALWVTDQVQLAAPMAPTTAGELQLLELLRLRIERWPLEGGVTELELTLEGVASTAEQRSLFTAAPKRSIAAANRAIARLRAELGGDCVVRGQLRDGHLPSSQFGWEPLVRLDEAAILAGQKSTKVVSSRPAPLIRRVWAKPRPFSWSTAHGPLRDTTAEPLPADVVALRPSQRSTGAAAGASAEERLMGPYVVSGGWWVRPVHREYHFAQLRSGELLWVYYDRQRRRWCLQGTVE